MKYDHFSMLPERAFQPRSGRFGMTLEGGGGGPSSSTTYTSNIPEWLRPQTEAVLGAATQEYFKTTPVKDPETGKITHEITGVKPFIPYSTNMEDYVAQFSPLQQQTQFEASQMQRPGQYGVASQLVGQAGMGGAESASQAYGYGGAGYGAGMTGQQLGITGGGLYGNLGAGYGAQAAGMAPEAQMLGRQGVDIGAQGLGYQGYGRDIGAQAMGYGAQAAGMGGLYERMATDPSSMGAYMSPYMQNVMERQKEAAILDAQKAQLSANLGAGVRPGSLGGSRQALMTAEREKALQSQLQNIQAQGLQKAYEDAQRAQQFGITTGLQGLQGAQQGLGTALQGGQLGLSGIDRALAGQQAGLQGLGRAGEMYGLGMQGAGIGLQGVQQQLAGTAQGMQGAGLGLQGVSGAQAGYNILGQAGTNLANIGTAQQAADLARMQFQADQGAQQQARQQMMIDQAIQNYAQAQEYPYQQLSKYSGLLRGYYTPSETRSTYQAYNPAAQITGLAAQGAGAIGALSRKAGGPIKEKKFAEGGITSIDQKVINDPTSYSPEMINKGIASGAISKMAGAIGLSAIENAKKQAENAQAAQAPAPQGTILGDLQANLGGIDTLPTNLPPQGMAGGGIVAFDNGGLTSPDIGAFTDEFLRRREAIGLGADEQAYRDYLKKRPEELTKQRDIDRYLALMKFGAAMGGAKTGNFLEALSQGTTAAIPELAAGEKAFRTGEAEAMRGRAEMDRMGRAEKLKALEAGETAYGRQQEMAARAKEGELDRQNRLTIANIPSKELQVAAQLRKDNPNMSYLDSITQASQAMAPKDTYNATRTAVSAAAKDANAEFMQRATFDPKLQEDMRKAAAGDAAAQKRIAAVKSKIQEDIFKLYQVEGVDLSSGRMGGASGATKNDPLGIR